MLKRPFSDNLPRAQGESRPSVKATPSECRPKEKVNRPPKKRIESVYIIMSGRIKTMAEAEYDDHDDHDHDDDDEDIYLNPTKHLYNRTAYTSLYEANLEAQAMVEYDGRYAGSEDETTDYSDSESPHQPQPKLKDRVSRTEPYSGSCAPSYVMGEDLDGFWVEVVPLRLEIAKKPPPARRQPSKNTLDKGKGREQSDIKMQD